MKAARAALHGNIGRAVALEVSNWPVCTEEVQQFQYSTLNTVKPLYSGLHWDKTCIFYKQLSVTQRGSWYISDRCGTETIINATLVANYS